MTIENDINYILELEKDPTLDLEFGALKMLKAVFSEREAMAGFIAIITATPDKAPTIASKLAEFRLGQPAVTADKGAVGDLKIKKMTPEQIAWLLAGTTAPKDSPKAKDKAVRNALGKPQASLNAELNKNGLGEKRSKEAKEDKNDTDYFEVAVDKVGKITRPLQKEVFQSKSPLGPKTPFAIYAVLEHKTTGDLKVCYLPIITPGEKNEITFYPAAARASAIADFDGFPNDLSTSPNPFATIKSLLPKLKTILEINTRNITKHDFSAQNLAVGFPLILALYQQTSASTLKNDDTFIADIDVISRLIRSKSMIDATLNATARAAAVRLWLPPLALNVMEKDGSFVTANTMLLRIAVLKEGLAKAHKYFGSIFPEYAFDFGDVIDAETTAFMNDRENITKFNLSDNYPALPLNTVRLMLDKAFTTNTILYHRIVLQLSTCLRNEELNRLNPNHLLPGGTLDYSSRPAAGLEQLSQKTASKRNRSAKGFTNAPTSVVTRIIMRYLKFSKRTDLTNDAAFSVFEKAESVFWKPGGEIRAALSAAFKDALVGGDISTELQGKDALQADRTHQRSLRTTGATMLRYGLTSRICVPIEPKVISERMAHVDGAMVERVYANSRPIDSKVCQTPDDYITIDGIEIEDANGKVVLITENEYLWDAWLLEDLYKRYAEKAETDAKKIAKHIFDELTQSGAGKHVPKRTRVKL